MKRTATFVALGLFAASVPFLIGYGADAGAEDVSPKPESASTGTLDIGTTELLDLDLTKVAQPERVLHYPGSDYVKVHFERLVLLPGDYVTVANPDGTESYRYESSLESNWATSITGDTAVVTLHTTKGVASTAVGAVGAQIDKVARSFTPEEMAERDDRRPESLCGGDDQLDAECYRESEPKIYANADPVARLLINGTTLCTAFRVGENNRMLTNNHCFDSTTTARSTEVWFNYRCPTCGGAGVEQPVKVRGDKVFATDRTYDFTLFSVDDFNAIEKFGSLKLANRQAKAGEKLYIPQNPGGAPTQIALNSDVEGGSCRVDDPTFDGYATDSDVSYHCDTEFGSSGSPVLSRETHEVIALHHFGGCPNSGVRSDRLISMLNGLL
ncbi:trypsin-like serine peptidase [Stackebrandtia soli]|uniref:trypsin-like serine peptidase n=1 Tax=Stackebrandtia soli TaxID=1892856 RepID=UPI0039ED5D3C